MATVTVELPSLLGDVLDGLRKVEVEGVMLGEAFGDLIGQHPRLAIHLHTEKGGLRRHIRCFLNDVDIRELGHMRAPLNDGDTITILQAISGG